MDKCKHCTSVHLSQGCGRLALSYMWKNNRINIANVDLGNYYDLAHLSLSSFAKNQEETLHISSFSSKKDAFARPGLHQPCSTMKCPAGLPKGKIAPISSVIQLPRAKCVFFDYFRQILGWKKRFKVNNQKFSRSISTCIYTVKNLSWWKLALACSIKDYFFQYAFCTDWCFPLHKLAGM